MEPIVLGSVAEPLLLDGGARRRAELRRAWRVARALAAVVIAFVLCSVAVIATRRRAGGGGTAALRPRVPTVGASRAPAERAGESAGVPGAAARPVRRARAQQARAPGAGGGAGVERESPPSPPPRERAGEYSDLPLSEAYDFVIVGAGSTGSIVGARLASAGFSVLLLEAGGPTQASLNGSDFLPGARQLTIFDVPLAWAEIGWSERLRREYRWPFSGDIPVNVARGVGGGGAQNAMISIRGLPADFEDWGEGWQWPDVVSYYLRWEGNTDFTDYAAYPYHNASGPIAVAAPAHVDHLSADFVTTALAAGIRFNKDFNGPERRGVGYYQFIVRKGVRDSPAAAYAGNGRRPAGLTVRPYAHVTRVLFADEGVAGGTGGGSGGAAEGTAGAVAQPRAVGVEWVEVGRDGSPVANSTRREAIARLETVLSAGALHTPKLLLLSGIGPKQQLARHGIHVRADRPAVGRSLQDGVYAIAQYQVGPSAAAAGDDDDDDDEHGERPPVLAQEGAPTRRRGEACWCRPLPHLEQAFETLNAAAATAGSAAGGAWCAQQLALYVSEATRGEGIFGTAGLSAGLFLRSPWAGRFGDDIQVTAHPYDKWQAAGPDAQLDGVVGRQPRAGVPATRGGGDTLSFEIANNQPVSRGAVTLASADPFEPPLIDHPYLKAGADVPPLVWAVQELRRILSFPPLAAHGLRELLPGAHVQSVEDLAEYVRCGARRGPPTLPADGGGSRDAHAARAKAPRADGAAARGGATCDRTQLPANHLGGTCRMGDATDPASVVDRELRVIGVRSLRLADASVMPSLPSGNTHATCMMIGERAAELLINEHRADLPQHERRRRSGSARGGGR